MPHVVGEIVINRPVEQVFDFVADERNEPQFNPKMLTVEASSRTGHAARVTFMNTRAGHYAALDGNTSVITSTT